MEIFAKYLHLRYPRLNRFYLEHAFYYCTWVLIATRQICTDHNKNNKQNDVTTIIITSNRREHSDRMHKEWNVLPSILRSIFCFILILHAKVTCADVLMVAYRTGFQYYSNNFRNYRNDSDWQNVFCQIYNSFVIIFPFLFRIFFENIIKSRWVSDVRICPFYRAIRSIPM